MNYSISARQHNIILLRPATYRITQNIYRNLPTRQHIIMVQMVGILCVYNFQYVSATSSTGIYAA